MSDLKQIVKKILKSYSYEIGEDHSGNTLVAQKEGRTVLVSIGPEPEAEIAQHISEFIESTKDFQGQRVVATLSGNVPPLALKAAEESGIAVWTHSTIESELGRLMMKDIMSGSGSLDGTDGAGGDASAEGDGSGPGAGEDGAQGPRDGSPQESDFTESGPGAAQVGAGAEQDLGEQIVIPKITLDDVTELAKYTIRGFRYELELVPYYIFEYSCETVTEGKAQGSADERKFGLLGVNALSGEYELWKSRIDLVPQVQWTHIKLEPKIDSERASVIAHDGVVAINTKEIESVTDKGTALIMERRRVRPKEGAIFLRRKGIIYLPVWCVEGSSGIMLVNAATGKIIKEDFYKE